jgi:hypothetical protein
MTQEKLDALQHAFDVWNHMVNHAFGVCLIAAAIIPLLVMIAGFIDDFYFDETPFCQMGLLFVGILSLGIYLL